MPTRRPKGEGSKPDQRADGRWQCYLTLPDDGRGLPADKRRKWFYGDTAAEAAAGRRAWQADQAAGRLDTSGNQTVSEYLRWWLATVVEPHLEPGTVAAYTTAVDRHLIPALGGRRLAALAAAHVQEFVRAQLASGLARATVNKHLGILRTALTYAVNAELVPRNRARAVRLPADDDPPERVVLTAAQARALLDHVAGTPLEAVVAVAVGVGLRKGEALGLRWADVTLARDGAGQITGGTLRVVQQTQREAGRLVVKGLKVPTARRTLPLPAVVARTLAAHQDRQRLLAGVMGDRWQDSDLVFTTRTGGAIWHQHIDTAWHRVRAALGLPGVRFHDLRHSAASLLSAQGVPLPEIMRLLGHTKLPMSLRYTHASPAGMEAAAERMDTALGAISGRIGGQADPAAPDHQPNRATS